MALGGATGEEWGHLVGEAYRRAHRAAVPAAVVAVLVGLGSLVPVAAGQSDPPPGALSGPEASSAPAAELPTDRVIVQYADAPSQEVREQLVERAGHAAGLPAAQDAEVLGSTVAGASVVELAAELTVPEAEQLAEQLASDPAVVRAAPDLRVVATGLPNDQRYAEQWSLPGIQAPAGWSRATGRSTVIGVVDTGVTAHRDLDPKVIGGYDFIDQSLWSNDGDGRDPDYRDPGAHGSAATCGTGYDVWSTWHGTHVAGIAAAATNNGVDVAGVAPDAQLLIGRALGACNSGYVSDVADAIRWMAGAPVAGVPPAPRAADVINLSLGSTADTCNDFYQLAVDEAVSRGVAVVAAAGNSGADASTSTPGNCQRVITVGATGQDGLRTFFSNHGPAVDLYAPGDQILSTSNTGNTGPLAGTVLRAPGTSAAAPHVAGAVALLRDLDPQATPAQLEQRLVETAVPFAGGRRLDVGGALGVAPSPFTDLVHLQEHYAEMAWLSATGVATGWDNGDGTASYRPLAPVARDAMAAFLYRLAGSPAYTPPAVSPFRDVRPGQQHYTEMAWLHETGIATGWPDGTYRPLTAVNRDAMAAFLHRYAGSPAYTPPAVSPFRDVRPDQEHYAEMAWLSATGVATGWDNGDGTAGYRPLAPVNRDAMAAFLHRISQLPD